MNARVRWTSSVRRIVAALVATWSLTMFPAATARADSDEIFQNDFCWNYFIADCPDPIDFYWRAATPISIGQPPDAHDWASLVRPTRTYFFYDPMPTGKHASWDFGLVGFGWDWWVVPASMWWFDNGVHPGLVIAPELASTFRAFDHSSYGQGDHAPSGEPGLMSQTTAFWYGDFWYWHWTCSWFVCYPEWRHLPMFAWRTRAHPVPVRQLQPVGIGH